MHGWFVNIGTQGSEVAKGKSSSVSNRRPQIKHHHRQSTGSLWTWIGSFRSEYGWRRHTVGPRAAGSPAERDAVGARRNPRLRSEGPGVKDRANRTVEGGRGAIHEKGKRGGGGSGGTYIS